MSRRLLSGAIIGANLLALVIGLPVGCAQTEAPPAPLPAGMPPEQGMMVAGQEPGAPPRRWPLVVQTGGDQVVMYQPQLESFQADTLTARAAVSIQRPGQQEPTFGVIWIQSRVATDRAARTVQILDANITRAKFPDAAPADEQALADALRQRLAEHPKILSLDQLLKMLQIVQQEQTEDANLQNTPPRIIFLDHPAVKVQYDGAPKLTQVSGSTLLRVVNTPFFVALDPAQKVYYLKGAGLWFAAPDLLGPFRPVGQAPPAIAQLADQSGYQDPQQPLAPSQAAAIEIVTATDPAELIWTDGPEEMGTIAGTDLLYVTNSDSDIFLEIGTQNLFVLLSGRWYTATSRNGPWTYVPPDHLPPDFARIPPTGPKGQVLAHVAGTPVAQDAVTDTYVPQTAAIDRAQVERPQVQYDGDPQFQAVERTPCSYAVNTAYSVVLVNRRYYCCHDACWYEAAAAVGPWDVCISVPHEIYLLPPSCPIYAVKYCYVYGYTPEVVYVGYTPGYVGCYPYHGCVVYGTGYYYRPWESRERYYPRPFTFGFAARYESYSGHWGFEVASAVGGGDYWIAPEPRREREQIVPGGHWFGYGGYRPVYVNQTTINNVTINRVNVNRTEINNRQQVEQSYNLYARRRDVRAQPARAPAQPAPPRGQPVRGGATPPANLRDNVYADPSGNVHRKTLDGWQTRQNGRWVPQQPAGGNAPPRQEGGRQVASPPAREETPAPRRQEPAAPVRQPQPQRQAEPQRQAPKEPARAAPPRPAAPARQAPSSSLDQDFRARVAGRDRYQNSPRPQPVPRAEPSPQREPPARSAPAGQQGGRR